MFAGLFQFVRHITVISGGLNGAGNELISAAGLEGAINLPTLSEQLYRSARWLRVFVARRDGAPPSGTLLGVLRRPPEELRDAVQRDRPLLA